MLTQSTLCLTHTHACASRGQAGARGEAEPQKWGQRKATGRQERKFHRLPKQSRRNCFQRHFGAGPRLAPTVLSLSRSRGPPLQLPGLGGGGWAGAVGACWRKSPQTRLGIWASDCPEPGGGVAEKSGPIWLVHTHTPDARLFITRGRVGNPRAPKVWPLKPGPPDAGGTPSAGSAVGKTKEQKTHMRF